MFLLYGNHFRVLKILLESLNFYSNPLIGNLTQNDRIKGTFYTLYDSTNLWGLLRDFGHSSTTRCLTMGLISGPQVQIWAKLPVLPLLDPFHQEQPYKRQLFIHFLVV